MLRSARIIFNTGVSPYPYDHLIGNIVSRIVLHSSGLEEGIVSRSFARNHHIP
jgi:hypothetical protein